jgi:hypothetical protein
VNVPPRIAELVGAERNGLSIPAADEENLDQVVESAGPDSLILERDAAPGRGARMRALRPRAPGPED